MFDYREALDDAIANAKESLPRDAYGAATYSLHYGPSGGGAEMSWDDALKALRAWADDLSDIELTEYGFDDDGEEVEYVAGVIDSRDIVAGVIGRDLASYL